MHAFSFAASRHSVCPDREDVVRLLRNKLDLDPHTDRVHNAQQRLRLGTDGDRAVQKTSASVLATTHASPRSGANATLLRDIAKRHAVLS